MEPLTDKHKESLVPFLPVLIDAWRENVAIAEANEKRGDIGRSRTLKLCPLCREAGSDCQLCPVFAEDANRMAEDDPYYDGDYQPCEEYMPGGAIWLRPADCQIVLDGLESLQAESGRKEG